MNPVLSFIILLLVLFLIVFFLYRSTQKQIKRVLSGERSLDDQDIYLRHAPILPALILNKQETHNPQARGIAKVELELQIRLPQGDPVQASTVWLVEIPALPDLEVGKTVEVKFDPQKPKRVFPAVPWARLWLFGK